MPQLLPDPWFSLFMISWLILLTLMVPKILKYKLLNSPQLQSNIKTQSSWNWPWP